MSSSENSNQDRWDRLWEIFHEAREKDPSERETYLKEVCGSDVELRQRDRMNYLRPKIQAGILTKGIAPDVTQGIGPGPSEDFSPGDVLVKRYQIVELIGQGGMGTVYKAVDIELQRQVALKFLTLMIPTGVRDSCLKHASRLVWNIPHICKVYEVGEIYGKQYIAMQLVTGKTMVENVHDYPLNKKFKS